MSELNSVCLKWVVTCYTRVSRNEEAVGSVSVMNKPGNDRKMHNQQVLNGYYFRFMKFMIKLETK